MYQEPPIYSTYPLFTEKTELVEEKSKFTPRLMRKIQEAVAYVDRAYQDHISAIGLSTEVKLSVALLQSGMKMHTGYTLYNYQEQVRIRSARRLLVDTEKSIQVIAKQVGFKTHSHFSEVFKRIVGVTPSEYRNQYAC